MAERIIRYGRDAMRGTAWRVQPSDSADVGSYRMRLLEADEANAGVGEGLRAQAREIIYNFYRSSMEAAM